MTITTPGLLFPAISLLLLAYTNRFVVLTNVVRQLTHESDSGESRDIIRRQIENFRRRLFIIRMMQAFGVLSFIFCTLSMFSLFTHWLMMGKLLFGGSLLLLVTSLIFSFYEVHISTQAITIELERLSR